MIETIIKENLNNELPKYMKYNNRWIFVGWDKIDEKFMIAKKETKKFIYITYKYLTGNIEEVRFQKI